MNKKKKSLMILILLSIIFSLFILIFPPKKISTYSNDIDRNILEIENKDVNKFEYVFTSNVEFLNKLIIPINMKNKVSSKIILYDGDGKIIKINSFQELEDKMILEFDRQLNSKGRIYRIRFNVNFDDYDFFITSIESKNYVINNNEQRECNIIIIQKGYEIVKYRIWYSIMFGTICFTLLGTIKEVKKNEK